MPIPSYTLGYPPDGSSLGQTKSTIRNNLDGTFETLSTDHINNNGPGGQPAGYHTIIHQVPQTSVDTVAGYNQVFSGVPGTLSVNSNITPNIPNNGDEELYSLSGDGFLSQLTGYDANVNGFAWVGGILLQWGIVADTNLTIVPVNFTPNFPNNCFNVQVTRGHTSSSPGSNSFWIIENSITNAGFSIKNDDSHTWGYIWTAIGN